MMSGTVIPNKIPADRIWRPPSQPGLLATSRCTVVLVAGMADFTRERPCPCGRGTYKVEEFDHDWGQSDEHWTMECTECWQRYVVFQYAYTEKGRRWRASVWVPRSNADELSRLDAALNDTEAEILKHAAGSYLDQWMALCDSSAPKSACGRS